METLSYQTALNAATAATVPSAGQQRYLSSDVENGSRLYRIATLDDPTGVHRFARRHRRLAP